MDDRYARPILDEGVPGLTSLFSWMVTIDQPDVHDAYSNGSTSSAEDPVPTEYQEFSMLLTHEQLHFMQAITTSYLYRLACRAFAEVQAAVAHVKNLPKGHVKLPISLQWRLPDMLDDMRVKSTELSTPEIPGISALDLMEGSAVYVGQRMQRTGMTNKSYLNYLATSFGAARMGQYSDAYHLAEWYLGDDVFEVFSAICYLALCTEEPGEVFCRYIRALGKSGILNETKKPSTQQIVDIGWTYGIRTVTSSYTEMEKGSRHPILTAHMLSFMANFPEGFPFLEFAARPYEFHDGNIFLNVMAPMTLFRGGTGLSAKYLPDYTKSDGSRAEGDARRTSLDILVGLHTLCGAILAMLLPEEHVMQCPHLECPFHKLQLCYARPMIPAHFEECTFPGFIKEMLGQDLSTFTSARGG
jgi:hypothetical protein